MSGFERVAMCVYCLSNVRGCYSDVGNAKRLLVMSMPCMLASLASIWFRLGVGVGVGVGITGITNALLFRGCHRQPLYCSHFAILLYGFMLR